MTENTPHIDQNRLYELMDEYENTTDRQELRRIENEVLAETVWQVRQEEFVLSERDFRTLLDRVDDDDEVVQRILIRPFVNRL